MKGRVAVFWHQIPGFFFLSSPWPQPPPSCGFMAYLPVADFHLAMSGDLWQVCCRHSDRGSRRKGISSRETVLDRMTRGRTCKFWGNLTPLGGPLRCERQACKIGQKIVWAKEFKGNKAENVATLFQCERLTCMLEIKISICQFKTHNQTMDPHILWFISASLNYKRGPSPHNCRNKNFRRREINT